MDRLFYASRFRQLKNRAKEVTRIDSFSLKEICVYGKIISGLVYRVRSMPVTTTCFKIKLLKLWEMLCQNTDETHPLTTNEIVERLEKNGIRCDRRTVTMDIDMLNECGYEVMSRFVGHNKAYYVADCGFSTSELKILIDAVQATTFITDKKSDELIKKLATLGGSYRADLLTRNLVAFNMHKHTNEQVYYAVLNIETALLERKKVSFFYYDLDENGERVYRKNKRLCADRRVLDVPRLHPVYAIGRAAVLRR